jgi:hypothetical protein
VNPIVDSAHLWPRLRPTCWVSEESTGRGSRRMAAPRQSSTAPRHLKCSRSSRDQLFVLDLGSRESIVFCCSTKQRQMLATNVSVSAPPSIAPSHAWECQNRFLVASLPLRGSRSATMETSTLAEREVCWPSGRTFLHSEGSLCLLELPARAACSPDRPWSPT